MKCRSLLTALLFCNVLFCLAQPQGVKIIPPQKQYADAMRPYYDTAKRKLVIPSMQNAAFDTKSLLPAQIMDKGAAANFHLTKDLNTKTDGNPYNYSLTSANGQYTVVNNISYFAADDGLHGTELWRSDVTTAGSYLVKDINPGVDGSNVFGLTAANGKVYFSATTVAEGTELWISDGTEAGTKLLKDILTGSESGSPLFLYTVNNTVFFTTNGSTGLFSSELWKTDGTAAGTVVVKDLYASGNYTSSAFQFSSANGLLYFTASSNTNGRELWRSDGTDAGTFMVKDINPDNYDFNGPSFLTAYNNHLYFTAYDGVSNKLWLTDGTTAGTAIAPGGNGVTFEQNFFFQNVPFAVIGNTMYMKATTAATGTEMYKYNATNAAGLVLLKDIIAGSGSSNIDYYNIVAAGNTLFFSVINADNSYSLWATKGGANNTIAVKNFGFQEYLNTFTDGYGTLFFSKFDTTYGYELWKSDGTAAGTALTADINPGNYSSSPYDMTPCNNKILFDARTLKYGNELWKTDGTTAGTKQVKDINKTTTAGSYAAGNSGQAVLANGIVFVANTPEYGSELYRSDGTANGTALVADIIPGENGSDIQNATANGKNVYFTSTVYTTGSPSRSIYRSNGSAVVKVVDVDYFNYYINSIAVADNGMLFYQVYNNYTGQNEVWRSNGTPAGTYQVHAGYSYNSYIITAGNTAFFNGNDDINGTELWKSDGTVAGTSIVKDIFTGSSSSSPYSYFAFNGAAYFAAYDGTSSSNSFWKSDGTAAGTLKLADVSPYSAYSYFDAIQHICVSGNALYFSGYTYDYGMELWKTNGTAAGTKLVKDINPGYSASNPAFLTDVSGGLFFTADDGVHGIELWASKGKATNTLLVKDITTGINSTNFYSMCGAAGKCFFSNNGYLWSSTGVESGTNLVSDSVMANVNGINGLIANGNKLFFGGYTYQYGSELYEGDASLVSFASVKSEEQNEAIAKPVSFDAKISPNPVASSALLQLTGEVKNASVTLSDMSGKVLWSTTVNNTMQIKLPVEKLTKGIYIVSVKSGSATKTIKLLKQ